MQRLCRPAVVSAAVAAMIVSGCGTEVSGVEVDGVEVDGVEVSPVEPPPVRAVVDYQIGGAYPPDPEVAVYETTRQTPLAGSIAAGDENDTSVQAGPLLGTARIDTDPLWRAAPVGLPAASA